MASSIHQAGQGRAGKGEGASFLGARKKEWEWQCM